MKQDDTANLVFKYREITTPISAEAVKMAEYKKRWLSGKPSEVRKLVDESPTYQLTIVSCSKCRPPLLRRRCGKYVLEIYTNHSILTIEGPSSGSKKENTRAATPAERARR